MSEQFAEEWEGVGVGWRWECSASGAFERNRYASGEDEGGGENKRTEPETDTDKGARWCGNSSADCRGGQDHDDDQEHQPAVRSSARGLAAPGG